MSSSQIPQIRLNPFGCPFYRVVTDGIRRKRVASVAPVCGVTSAELIEHPVNGHGNGVGELSVYSDIGSRKSQEDRFLYCPSLAGRADSVLLAIFDGTVGDFASHNIKSLILPHLLSSAPWVHLCHLLEATPYVMPAASTHATELFPIMADLLDSVCYNADRDLLKRCEIAQQHYSASTGVIALIVAGCCAIAHLGDSRAALCHYGGYMSDIIGNFLTDDHKPHQLYERSRIRQCGGSVEYLHNHNNRAFIRGGDFIARKGRGEQPMQLQYSRAFGGKDLKCFGLSSDPDVICFRIESWHCSLILGSDGLWDVMGASQACEIAQIARKENRDPAEALVKSVLTIQAAQHQLSDNVTAMVLFFNTEYNGHFPPRCI